MNEDFLPAFRERLKEALPRDEAEAAVARGAKLSFRDLVRAAQAV